MSEKVEFTESFSNHIYLVIADYSWEIYAKSKFSNYFTWASYVDKYITTGNLGPVTKYVEDLSNKSQEFFGFSDDDMTLMCMEFFLFKKYHTFYEHIRLFRAIHGGYIIKNNIKQKRNGN